MKNHPLLRTLCTLPDVRGLRVHDRPCRTHRPAGAHRNASTAGIPLAPPGDFRLSAGRHTPFVQRLHVTDSNDGHGHRAALARAHDTTPQRCRSVEPHPPSHPTPTHITLPPSSTCPRLARQLATPHVWRSHRVSETGLPGCRITHAGSLRPGCQTSCPPGLWEVWHSVMPPPPTAPHRAPAFPPSRALLRAHPCMHAPRLRQRTTPHARLSLLPLTLCAVSTPTTALPRGAPGTALEIALASATRRDDRLVHARDPAGTTG